MTSTETDGTGRMLEEGRTVWRIAHAARAALLVDAADYFGALRSAMARARESIVVLGWDIDSRTPLVGRSGRADDGAPETLLPYLEHLIAKTPGLTVHLLLWDYSLLYALDREPLPSLNLKWRTPERLKVALDNCLPVAACHHQKLVVIDGRLAFCGGLDLTIRRWDTSEHRVDHPRRVDTDNEPYPPFHDLQMIVDGRAAEDLFELARLRWQEATSEEIGVAEADGNWPHGLEPDFEDVEVGIARTLPASDARAGVTEVRDLYLASIERAERWIYIENQYLTADCIADALVERLREKRGLEVVAVTPRMPRGWLEAQTMGSGRQRFREKVAQADLTSRVRFLYPWVGGDRDNAVMVHAKLMIVDDVLLRVGSANLNNRSMGVDSECDLVVAGETAGVRRRIRALLCRLLGEHLGADAGKLERELDRAGSLIAVTERMSQDDRGLAPLAAHKYQSAVLADVLNFVADPEQPLRPEEFIGDMFAAKTRRSDVGRLIKLGIAAAVLLGIALVWSYTPLAEWADPEVLMSALSGARDEWWIYPFVIVAYVLGSLVFFPLTVLIVVTGMMFGPFPGFLCAMAGGMAGSWAGYVVGDWTGAKSIRNMSGRTFRAVYRGLQNQSVASVLALRMVPIAPFTVVNMVMGAARVPARTYLAGTALGLLPGIFIVIMLGDRLREVWRDPHATNILLFSLVMVLWVGLAFALQRIVGRIRRKRSR
ncbi:MAG: VTT domain-containing protein [Woeseiaceae bacterium]